MKAKRWGPEGYNDGDKQDEQEPEQIQQPQQQNVIANEYVASGAGGGGGARNRSDSRGSVGNQSQGSDQGAKAREMERNEPKTEKDLLREGLFGGGGGADIGL